MSESQKSKKRLFLLFIFIVIALITSPFWVWKLQQEKTADIVIIDKTVQRDTYREHSGLVWALNHLKIKKQNGDSFGEEKDFSVTVPLFKKSEMPELLYVADSYGVELVQNESVTEVDGGLSIKEVENIRSMVMSGKADLIAEFNTFASPTEKAAREGISELLNVKWTGWIGRYFADMNGTEVPSWVKKNYQDRHGKWEFNEGGMLFVHENGNMLVLEDMDMKEKGALFSFTEKGEAAYGLDASVPYQYWFDIIAPFNEEEVMASYELKLTDKGKNKVQKHQIPLSFPAILHHQNATYSSTYFAGDYADQAELPELYQTWGLSWIKQQFSLDDGKGSTFYWKVYLPLMKKILNEDNKKADRKETVEIHQSDAVKTNARAEGDYLQVLQNGKWEDLLIKGVNLGIAKPGSFPGETAISKSEYFRWFKRIGEMNANAIRVYTIHPPGFYEAFYEYNQTAEKPLFLFHGVWVNEDQLLGKKDVYAPEVSNTFKKEIQRVVDIINGHASIPKVPGHAGGDYKKDISKYVLGYILGVEWDPEVVVSTNEKHPERKSYSGTYFSTVKETSPFESWLASMMDYTTNYETGAYKWQHAVSHVNWVTTDTLNHPAEPFEKEDMVSVDPNAIEPQDAFQSGYFASYHVYPYYPDFLNYEKKYLDYVDHRGEKNNFAGYLHDLRQVHEMPVLVAEFGVPSSRGITHENAYGWNQGHHSEKEQGTIDTRLFEDIAEEKMAGGMVFAWQDEWFKRTWNTMDFDNPDRRPYWSNAQTNEQQFGLLSFDPEPAISVDGETNDWFGLSPYQKGSSADKLKALYVTSDSRYVYMRIDYGKKMDSEHLNTTILVDSIPDQGQQSSPDNVAKVDAGVDFAINLVNKKKSRMLVDSYYDSHYYLYGHQLNMIEKKDYASKNNNGVYHPILMALNKGLTIPSTKEKIPFQAFETGKLQFGNADPTSKHYNSLTDVSVNEKEGIVEMRIPWLLLNVKDPSLHEIRGNMWGGNVKTSTKSDGFSIAAVTYREGSNKKAEITDSLPRMVDGVIPLQKMKKYLWDEWTEPTYNERLKQSYYDMQKTYEKVKGSGE